MKKIIAVILSIGLLELNMPSFAFADGDVVAPAATDPIAADNHGMTMDQMQAADPAVAQVQMLAAIATTQQAIADTVRPMQSSQVGTLAAAAPTPAVEAAPTPVAADANPRPAGAIQVNFNLAEENTGSWFQFQIPANVPVGQFSITMGNNNTPISGFQAYYAGNQTWYVYAIDSNGGMTLVTSNITLTMTVQLEGEQQPRVSQLVSPTIATPEASDFNGTTLMTARIFFQQQGPGFQPGEGVYFTATRMTPQQPNGQEEKEQEVVFTEEPAQVAVVQQPVAQQPAPAQGFSQWLSDILGNAIQSLGITFDASGKPWISIQAPGGYTIWVGYGLDDNLYRIYVDRVQNGPPVLVIPQRQYRDLGSFLEALNNLSAEIRRHYLRSLLGF